LCGNIINTSGKFIAYFLTGSSSMLSEGLHSLADVANQSLLFIGVKRSQRPATQDHPYGFEGERYVYALISATGIFFVGACFSVYHGIYHIFHPGELENLWFAFSCLFFSGIIEFVSFSTGVLAVKQGAKENGMSFYEFLKSGPDPMGVSVVMEDGAAMLGLVIAGCCLGVSFITGNTVFDAVGSVLIGSLLGTIAVFLIQKNAKSLSTRAAPTHLRAKIIKILKKDPVVQSVHHVKAIQVGTSSIAFSADVEFEGRAISERVLDKKKDIVQSFVNKDNPEEIKNLLIEYGSDLVESMGDEVDRLEKHIKNKVPEAKYVDLECN